MTYYYQNPDDDEICQYCGEGDSEEPPKGKGIVKTYADEGRKDKYLHEGCVDAFIDEEAEHDMDQEVDYDDNPYADEDEYDENPYTDEYEENPYTEYEEFDEEEEFEPNPSDFDDLEDEFDEDEDDLDFDDDEDDEYESNPIKVFCACQKCYELVDNLDDKCDLCEEAGCGDWGDCKAKDYL